MTLRARNTLRGHSPLFGAYELEPQHEPPKGDCVGYVRLRGITDRLIPAIWRNGKWHDKNLRPLAETVEMWYNMRTNGAG